MMYQIWMEGCRMNGGGFNANYVGSAVGDNFREAVLNWFKYHPSSSFDSRQLTEWGCRLYSNEMDARKSFG